MSLFVDLTTPNGIKYKQPTGIFINGEFVRSASGKTFKVEDPATEKIIVEISESSSEDVDRAVEAAKAATPEWEAVSTYDRGRVLHKIADAIEEIEDTFVAVETWDNGKTISMSRDDVTNTIKCFRYYAGFADKINGQVVEIDKESFNYTRREPIGICGMVIPWNYPLLMLAWKIAPALACGNTCILKSAESTPLTALMFAEITQKVGIPKGVINILSGYGDVGAVICSHPEVKKIAFTGSTATGRKILQTSAQSNLKKVTLELGGKSPNIVFEDADLDEALDSVITGIFYNQGEVCCAGSRLLLQKSIYEKFLEVLKGKVEKLKVGDPFAKSTFYGAQTNKIQYEKVLDYISKGVDEGNKLLTGGKPAAEKGQGYFIQPTIFYDVKNSDTVAREEIFGPVLSVISFDTVEEAIQLANDNVYGLASGLHTKDVNKALYVANSLKAGTVWVNTFGPLHHQLPFGGYGFSGIGRELGEQALANYTETKAVRILGIQKASSS